MLMMTVVQYLLFHNNYTYVYITDWSLQSTITDMDGFVSWIASEQQTIIGVIFTGLEMDSADRCYDVNIVL